MTLKQIIIDAIATQPKASFSSADIVRDVLQLKPLANVGGHASGAIWSKTVSLSKPGCPTCKTVCRRYNYYDRLCGKA